MSNSRVIEHFSKFLVDAIGVGDRGYLLAKLINNEGKSVPVYEHEAVFSCVWGSWKSWREYVQKMEIDHIDRNPKNNNIENLRLIDRPSQNTPEVLADMRKRIDLNMDIARQIRNDYENRTGGKVKFYKSRQRNMVHVLELFNILFLEFRIRRNLNIEMEIKNLLIIALFLRK